MMESYDENYVGYLEHNPFSVLVVISDGEHRDHHSRNPVRNHSQRNTGLFSLSLSNALFFKCDPLIG